MDLDEIDRLLLPGALALSTSDRAILLDTLLAVEPADFAPAHVLLGYLLVKSARVTAEMAHDVAEVIDEAEG
jgi:hypothetical protein